MATVTKDFIFQNKKISFSNEIDQATNKIFVSRYFFIEVQGRLCEVTGKTTTEEYYNDLKIQLNFLEHIALDLDGFYWGYLECCLHHIKKHGRLVVSDMHAKLNSTMHIMDVTNGLYHSFIKKKEDGIKIREALAKSCIKDLADDIYVPHPFLKSEDGKAKFIPIKEAY